MKIEKGRLVGANYAATKHVHGRIHPTGITVHETAGPIEKGNAVRYCRDNPRGVAYHFVIERDGTVTQLAPCDAKLWHAGGSANGTDIAVSMVGPGRLARKGREFLAWYARDGRGIGRWAEGDPEIAEARLPGLSSGHWLAPTNEQRAAVASLCGALVAAYPITRIRAHWELTTRKEDPSPLFDMAEFRSLFDLSTPVVSTTLAVGSRNPPVAVTDLQRRLAVLGYHSGAADGIYGPRTRAAVLAFQAENGLTSDGIAGLKTLNHLASSEAKAMPGRDPAAVAATIKQSLTVAGARTAKSAASGLVTLAVAGTTISEAPGLVDQLAEFGQLSAALKTSLEPAVAFLSFVASNIKWLLAGGIVFGGYLVWRSAGRAEAARVEDAVSGANLGG